MLEQKVFMNSNNQQVFLLPWQATAPCPWDRAKHERIVIPCDVTRKGKHAIVQVVRRDKLKFA